jgi:glycosyltransferase involved in cell wall biosynthesis
MTDVKVTVLMPAYNAADFIAEAMASVLCQTFADFELLIVNDGSTDNTVEVVKSFNDNRIVLIEQENLGVAAALNTGLQHARAAYIARFDADDICLPTRLETQYHFMASHPEYVVVGSAADYIDASGDYVFTHWPQGKTDAQIKLLPYYVCPFIHASVMYKKTFVAEQGYNIHAHSFEDHLLWQQLKHKGKLFNLPTALLTVRLNPRSVTMDERKRPKEFHEIKNKALRTGTINTQEGNRLLTMIKEQQQSTGKEGAYYSLLAKKFLWNNYDPAKARAYVKKAITLNSFDIKDYMLWAASFLPKAIIHNLYHLFASTKG